MNARPSIDAIDAAILRAVHADPDATTVAIAEATGLARNTVRARLRRYAEDGTLLPYDHRISPRALGYPVSAYLVTKVKQRLLAEVGRALGEIPEVLHVQGLSGVEDLLVEVAARDDNDLYRIAGLVLDIEGVKRTTTGLVMRELVGYRVNQLIPGAAPDASGRERSGATG